MTWFWRCEFLAPLLFSLPLAGCTLGSAEPAAPAPAAAPPVSHEARWVGTWAASPSAFQVFGPAPAPQSFANQTLRQKLRISVGGDRLRIRLSNELGATPLVIGAASVAVAAYESAIDPASLHKLTFGGQDSIKIPAGAPAVTDPVDLAVGDLAELAMQPVPARTSGTRYPAHGPHRVCVHGRRFHSGCSARRRDTDDEPRLPDGCLRQHDRKCRRHRGARRLYHRWHRIDAAHL